MRLQESHSRPISRSQLTIRKYYLNYSYCFPPRFRWWWHSNIASACTRTTCHVFSAFHAHSYEITTRIWTKSALSCSPGNSLFEGSFELLSSLLERGGGHSCHHVSEYDRFCVRPGPASIVRTPWLTTARFCLKTTVHSTIVDKTNGSERLPNHAVYCCHLCQTRSL